MKVDQLLRENLDDVFYCTKRSEIARSVASMSMAESIDFAIEYQSDDHLTKAIDQVDYATFDYVSLRKMLMKHTRLPVSSLGSGLISTTFDHRKQLDQLKACLEDIADYFDPEKKDVVWRWKVSLQDNAWMTS